MNIIWKGQSCFQISTNSSKNGPVLMVIDPYGNDCGLRVPKLKADILLISHDHKDHNNIKAVSNNPFLIENPGEYDVKGVFIRGFSAFHDNSSGGERGKTTIYIIKTEGVKICHLGDFGQKELSASQLEKIGDIDILMIPVGGTYTINGKEAVKIISQIEPKITIPMHYKISNLKIKLDNVNNFLKELGIKKLEPIDKLSIKKKDLSSDEAKIVILKP